MDGFLGFLFIVFGGFAGLIGWDEILNPSTTREESNIGTIAFGVCAVVSVVSFICLVV